MSPDSSLSTLAAEAPRIWAFKATDIAAARRWQADYRPQLRTMLGLDTIERRGTPPMNAERLSTHRLADHVREEWTLETEPGYRVSFFLLLPLEASGKLPLVLTPHGHGGQARREYCGLYASEEDRQRIESEELDVALQAVREGYAVIAPDMRGFADLRLREDVEAAEDNSCWPLSMRALLVGRTLLGERVWDMQRLLDWALGRDDIDAGAVVLTGNSGGGTVTLFASAVDERVRVCVPVCYFCSFERSIGAIKHCPCNYLPGMLRAAEMSDVAALIAPRPFLAVNGAQDPIFPIDATRASHARLREAYALFGAEDSCCLEVGAGGHRYYKALVWPVVREYLARG